jgi:hypothetical protein
MYTDQALPAVVRIAVILNQMTTRALSGEV